MTDLQLDALIKLMVGSRISDRMKAALREFFADQERARTQREIAKSHGVSPTGLNMQIQEARKRIKLACVLVTGQQY